MDRAGRIPYAARMDTLLLTRSNVAALLDPNVLFDALREAFIAYSTKRSVDAQRIPVYLPAAEVPAGATGMLMAPGLVPGIPAYSVKVHAKYPGGDPAIRGLLVLHDLATGAPLAVMESSYLTALRTGLAGALAADTLARPDARVAAVIGAGAQGRAQLAGLRRVRAITAVRIFDALPAAAARLASDPAAQGLVVTLAGDLDEALDGADIVATATWAKMPFLFRRHLHPGLHITTLGPDEPGKCEIAADALSAARVVVDDRSLAVAMGCVGGAGLGGEAIQAELGEVLAGVRPGRTDAADITIFGAVGLPFQDLAAAWLVYSGAKERGIGRRLDFLS